MVDGRLKVLYISGTRADFGLMKGVLEKMRKNGRFDLKIVATGMHLMPEFGSTIKDIEQESYPIITVDETQRGDTRWDMAEFVGRATWRFAEVFRRENPDFVLVLGDRSEMLAAATAAVYGGVPVAHLHGGEVSGSIDESARHAITKLAHIHFPSTKRAAERIIRMGEDRWRVHLAGAPSLDTILGKKLPAPEEMRKRFGLRMDKPTMLVVQHPVVSEDGQAWRQMHGTMEAVKTLGCQAIVIYPNADAGGMKIIDIIKGYEREPGFQTFKNLPYETYLGLLQTVDVLVGNSSSGIIEAPSFKLPVVNIGTRQQGREQSANVINCGYKQEEIEKAIQKALSKPFKAKARKCKNVYGDGKAGERLIRELTSTKVDAKLLQKRNAY